MFGELAREEMAGIDEGVAAFLGLLWPRLPGKDPIAVAIIAAVATIAMVPLVPPGIPVLVAAAVTAGVWARRHYARRATA